MLTNIRESKGRLLKEAEISTFPGRYHLDTPGNGLQLPYFEDPHMRIQTSSGIRASSGTVDWESELRGMTRLLKKGDVEDYHSSALPIMNRIYIYDKSVSDESRSILPAWTFREKEQDRWETPFLNPLDKAFIPFEVNMNVRRRECDQMDDPNGACSGPRYSESSDIESGAVLFEPLLPITKAWEAPSEGFAPYLHT